jgi:hypothetical protein
VGSAAVAGQGRGGEAANAMKIQPGQVLKIPEADYLYGVGVLTLRVTDVRGEVDPRLRWLRIRGVEILWNGQEGAEREVMVRVSALPGAAGSAHGGGRRGG